MILFTNQIASTTNMIIEVFPPTHGQCALCSRVLVSPTGTCQAVLGTSSRIDLKWWQNAVNMNLHWSLWNDISRSTALSHSVHYGTELCASPSHRKVSSHMVHSGAPPEPTTPAKYRAPVTLPTAVHQPHWPLVELNSTPDEHWSIHRIGYTRKGKL